MDKFNWKSYVAGAASAAVAAGVIYFGVEANKYRGDKVLSNKQIDGITVKLIEEDRKWSPDNYRIEITDKDGKLRAKFYGERGKTINKARFKDADGTESGMDF